MADHTEQTTLVHNEEEAFALEPIDITGEKLEVLCSAYYVLGICLSCRLRSWGVSRQEVN